MIIQCRLRQCNAEAIERKFFSMMNNPLPIREFIVPGKRAHLVGIGGVSMCPLADCLLYTSLKFRWLRNFYRMCIAYASRPELSSRLTLGGRTFPKKP